MFLLVFVLASFSVVLSLFEYGLNAGAQYDTSLVNYVVESGTTWVRLNFIVTASQTGPDDPNFQAMYDSIINAYVQNNIKVYGLIGAESVKSGYNRNDPQSFIEPLVNASISIINRYQNLVKVYEIFNEPNDWAGGTSAQVPPYYFAGFMSSVYNQKLVYNWNVTIVSGPLFSWDQDTGASYLYETYDFGISNWDWESIYSKNNNKYPLDGIGYHIYCDGGTTDENEVISGYNYNINDLWNNGVIKGETINHSDNNVYGKKYVWVSEFGWGSNDVTEQGQSDNLYTVYTSVFSDLNTGGQYITLGMWFTLQDFSSEGWGLRYQNLQPKLAWSTYSNLTRVNTNYNH